MTMHFSRTTLRDMDEEWKKQYIRHVLDVTGLSLSAVAAKAGLSSTTLTRPMNADDHKFSMKLNTIEAVQRATGVPFGSFVAGAEPTGAVDGYPSASDDALIPVYDVAASAGFGALVDYEQQTHSLAFPPDYLRKLTSSSPSNLAIISVKGESMEPTLLDDDIVLVDMSKTHMGFEGLFVIRHNETLLVKRAGMSAKNGHVTLLSDNKAYPPVEASLADLSVVGKVLWYGRKV